MAKTALDCRDQILSTVMAGLVETAAQAMARVSMLEEGIEAERERVAAIDAEFADYKKANPPA